MFVSINWIKDYVDLSGLDIEKLIHQFNLSTAEVEDIIYKGKDVDKVVVGEIVSFEEHPDKEKLKGKKVLLYRNGDKGVSRTYKSEGEVLINNGHEFSKGELDMSLFEF